MSCDILVCNKAGVSGEISGISDSKLNYTHNETFAAWRSKFPNNDVSEYHRNFSLIKISDKTSEELSYLTGHTFIDNDIVNRWYFVLPSSSTDEWKVLFLTGEISKTFAEVLIFIRERS
tara:strand:+ start:4352 stop:4708 length:357 start_codon:yes stop_codon:yes gene_type:complete